MTTQIDRRSWPAGQAAAGSNGLFDAALAIVSAPALEEMLHETTVRAAQIIGARQASTVLLLPDTDTAIATSHTPGSDGSPATTTAQAARPFARRGLQGEVCRTNEPLRLSHSELEKRPDWYSILTERRERGEPALRGVLAVPLVGREGTNLGLIELSDKDGGEFGDGDETLLASLAQFTAMAIEQLRLHADLAYQSGLTRTVAENATSGLLLMDPAGRVTYMNSAGARIIGYDIEGLAGRTLHEVIHHSRPDGTPLRLDECLIWRTTLGQEARPPFEDAFIRPDGSFYPVRVAAAPVLRDDRVVGVVLEVADTTTEQDVAGRLSDLALSASDRAAKLRGLIQAIGDAVVVSEPNGAVSLMNPAAVTLFGPRSTNVGQLLKQLRTEDGMALDAGAVIGGSYLLRGTDRDTWLEARSFPVPTAGAGGRADSNVTERAQPIERDHGRIYVFRDVTAARLSKVMRETFIGMLSHELRTPITTVYGGTKVLSRRSEQLLPEVRSLVGDIEAEAERLYRLVEDLVVLTKSEAASLEAGREPVLLQRLLPKLVAAEARRWPSVTFTVDAGSAMAPVLAEQTYVEQVVRNLLTNAGKYGGTSGTVEVVGASEGNDVVVRVLDRGPGFPEGDADRLFDIYYRSPQVARRAAGAGIGLFVCKSLVEAMGGRIWAKERKGGGAEFGFSLAALADEALGLDDG